VNAAHGAERALSSGVGRLIGSSPEIFVSIQATPFDSAPCTAAFLVRPSRRPPQPITWRFIVGARELGRKNQGKGSETDSYTQSCAAICNWVLRRRNLRVFHYFHLKLPGFSGLCLLARAIGPIIVRVILCPRIGFGRMPGEAKWTTDA